MKWHEIVGQQKQLSMLDFYFNACAVKEPLPSFMIVAPRGSGKTTIAQAFGQRVKESFNRRFFEVNAAGIKNLPSFFEEVVLKCVVDKDMILHVDEASDLPHDVQMFLLSMLNPSASSKNVVTFDGLNVDIDLRRQSFMFSTTEPQCIFHALMNRCRRIDLDDYSNEDLAEILRRNSPKVTYAPDVLSEIVSTVRGTARQAVMRAQDINLYAAAHNSYNFGRSDWSKLVSILGINPLGLNSGELKILALLSCNKDVSLTRLAATLELTPVAVQRDLELYLQKNGLMEISANGRNLTAKGYEYLKHYANQR